MNDMPAWLEQLWNAVVVLFPLLLWFAFWLWGVNWSKMWPTLAQGAWAPLLLLIYISAEVWSRIDPGPCTCVGGVSIPNFWWQMGSVCGLVFLAFCAGWLQDYMGWTPAEIDLDAVADDHGHAHH